MIPDVLLRGEVARQGRRAREGRWRRRRRAVGTAGGPREGSVPAPGDGQGPVKGKNPWPVRKADSNASLVFLLFRNSRNVFIHEIRTESPSRFRPNYPHSFRATRRAILGHGELQVGQGLVF